MSPKAALGHIRLLVLSFVQKFLDYPFSALGSPDSALMTLRSYVTCNELRCNVVNATCHLIIVASYHILMFQGSFPHGHSITYHLVVFGFGLVWCAK
ncbi:hypothetical protein E2C01_029220 [Portunus trituberculatus]|uniref:Uncharacterized protein n=1 Tax=Portunus trituberculatus TaxID=210409 RepID=A0A5B7EQW9_PORTR|nr:hypothetical protein [Portunus trituberculatus]